jgi:hypothetical protein
MYLHSQKRGYGLGIAPAVAAPVILGTAAIGGLLGLVQNNLDDNWTDSSVFKVNMRKIHAAMLALQCYVGGAQSGTPLVDTFGEVVCPAGTKPVCQLNSGELTRWRSLRDGFSSFWTGVSQQWTSITNAQANQAKQFAVEFAQFWQNLQAQCSSLKSSPLAPLPAPNGQTPDWLKYATWGVGALAVITLAVAAKSIFGKH